MFFQPVYPELVSYQFQIKDDLMAARILQPAERTGQYVERANTSVQYNVGYPLDSKRIYTMPLLIHAQSLLIQVNPAS